MRIGSLFENGAPLRQAVGTFDVCLARPKVCATDIVRPHAAQLRPRPHECVFIWKRKHFAAFSCPVHTKTMYRFRWKRSPEWKNLKTQQYRLRVDGLNSLKTQTFENDWSCDVSRRISKDNVLLFSIGISLLLSLIVNWQLNVYAHQFK